MAPAPTPRPVISPGTSGYRCDICKEALGVCVTDTFWTCRHCALIYLQTLELERYAGTASPWGKVL